MSDLDTEPVLCTNCGAEQASDYKYCSQCGAQKWANYEATQVRRTAMTERINTLGLFAGLMAVVILIAAFVNESWQSDIIISILFAALTLAFVLQQGSEVWKKILPSSFQASGFLLAIGVTVGTAYLVPTLIAWANEALGFYDFEVTEIYMRLEHPRLVAIVFLALFPAIFEELALRGVVYHNLEKLSNPSLAILGSAFLFALLHFSLLSLFWLFPFGLFLGWLRHRYQNMLYGMIGHFTHNALVVISELEGWF